MPCKSTVPLEGMFSVSKLTVRISAGSTPRSLSESLSKTEIVTAVSSSVITISSAASGASLLLLTSILTVAWSVNSPSVITYVKLSFPAHPLFGV